MSVCKKSCFLLIFASGFFSHWLQAQSDCEIRKNEKGIQVYSCAVEDSNLKSIKAVFDLHAELDQLVSVLRDVSAYSSWQYRMINPKLIRSDANTITYYGEISAPWPVSNRDMIVELKFNYDSALRTMEVKATGLPAALPAVKNVIRVPEFKAKWHVAETTSHELKIEYELLINIGGAIPIWIMNIAQAEGPYETFSNLKTHIHLKKYQNPAYSTN